MPAGTIALTNNSTAVTGSGTNFSSELKANDFLVAIVGGVTYTLGVQSVNSATSVTLTTAYNGPTTSGLAWTAVPNAALVGITAQVAADVAKAIRGLNLDKANWQQVYSASGNITVTLPDGTQYSGPSWKSLATSLSGLGDSATRNVGTTAGTVAAGDDSRLNTLDGKTGGTVTSPITVNQSGNYAVISDSLMAEGNGSYNTRAILIKGRDTANDIQIFYRLLVGTYQAFRLVQNATETFRAQNNGACYAVSFNPTSDSNLKFNKRFIDDAIIKYVSLRGMTYQLNGERRAGIIAQDAEKFLPESVTTSNDPVVLEDGTILHQTKSLDYSGTSATGVEAFKALFPLLLKCLEDPEAAKRDINDIISAINYSTEDANETDMRMEWALVNQPETPPEAPETDSANADH